MTSIIIPSIVHPFVSLSHLHSVFLCPLCFPEHWGPRGLCNHCAHGTGYLPDSVCTCLHWVHLQEASTRFLSGHLGVLGCHGLPFYVFWWNRLSMGSGRTNVFRGEFICCRQTCGTVCFIGFVSLVLFGNYKIHVVAQEKPNTVYWVCFISSLSFPWLPENSIKHLKGIRNLH